MRFYKIEWRVKYQTVLLDSTRTIRLSPLDR